MVIYSNMRTLKTHYQNMTLGGKFNNAVYNVERMFCVRRILKKNVIIKNNGIVYIGRHFIMGQC